MDTHLLDYTLKELFMLSKKNKLDVISLLINSIADDKVYDAETFRETELEYKSIITGKEALEILEESIIPQSEKSKHNSKIFMNYFKKFTKK